MPLTKYGDISPRTAGFAAKEMLKRAMPHLVLERFGQAKPLPGNSSKVIIFRRYEALDHTPVALVEGVTPNGKKLTHTDVSAELEQFGDYVSWTDVIEDTHEDPVLQEAMGITGEQAAQLIEVMRWNKLKAGSNVFYANGAARNGVNKPICLSTQRKVTRFLKRQNAKKMTKVVKSTPSYGTEAVAPSFIGLVHSDCEADIRAMPGFTPVEKYGSITPYESEIGKVEDVRYVYSTIFEPWENAGGTKGSGATEMLSTGGTNTDVYPVLYLAQDAYGLVPLKGKFAIAPLVHNPKVSDSDPLAQRGHVGWKSMQTAVILNDMWMVRTEVGVTANPSGC